MRKINRHREPEFIKAFKSGKSREELMEMFSVKKARIGEMITLARKEGLIGAPRKERNPIDMVQARSLHAQGLTFANIAANMGRCSKKVAIALRSAGLPSKVPTYGEDVSAQIRSMYASGTPIKQISKILGLTQGQVTGRASRMGLTKVRAKDPRTLTDADKEKIKSMWMTYRTQDIADAVGCGTAAVSRWAKRMKLQPKKATTLPRTYKPRGSTAKENVVAPKHFKEMAVASDTVPDFARPWMTRASGECAYPYGIKGSVYSCCKPVWKHGTYCEGHAALCGGYKRIAA